MSEFPADELPATLSGSCFFASAAGALNVGAGVPDGPKPNVDLDAVVEAAGAGAGAPVEPLPVFPKKLGTVKVGPEVEALLLCGC